MPRTVDPAARRKSVAEAVWRLVGRSGLEAVSVRTVASEAGLSPGAVRHYFADQLDVLAFAMRLATDQVRSRVAPLLDADGGALDPEAVIEELLPLDAQRLAEAEIWQAFFTRAQHEPRLRAVRDETYDLLEGLCARLAAELTGHQLCRDCLAVETERLYALIDGLVLHGAARPDRATPELLRATIRHHLGNLSEYATERCRRVGH